jgi:hypothetical protein
MESRNSRLTLESSCEREDSGVVEGKSLIILLYEERGGERREGT